MDIEHGFSENLRDRRIEELEFLGEKKMVSIII